MMMSLGIFAPCSAVYICVVYLCVVFNPFKIRSPITQLLLTQSLLIKNDDLPSIISY